MNSIYFGAKRVFHGFLRITRKPFLSNELTAARFDLMVVVHKHYSSESTKGRALFQSEVWRQLGVTPGVVCRMMRSLEELGLIRRRVPERGAIGGSARWRSPRRAPGAFARHTGWWCDGCSGSSTR